MASSNPSAFWIVSLLAFVATFACFSAAQRECKIDQGGSLITFNREVINRVTVPCKYHFADFTCGDYRVKVTPGNDLGTSQRAIPVTVWVKVVNTATNETVKLRTSNDRLRKAAAGELDNAWEIKEGNTDFLEVPDNRYYAADVHKDGVFTVQFSLNRVQVYCEAPEFSSRGVPETLCGTGSTFKEIEATKNATFDDETFTVADYLQYIVLNDTTVTQSKTCAALARNFQGCETKYQVHLDCNKFFNDRALAQCLFEIGTLPEVAYDYCLRKNCYDDDSNRPYLGNCTTV